VEGGAERRIVTVLFADLVGFTALSERLDAEDVSIVQGAYFDTVRETIERHGGRLEKFIGDAVMAVWGAPRARDDDAERAVRAGLALTGAVEHLGARLGIEGELRLRVGVNSGEVVQAAEQRDDRALVTGDTVNVAARLQAAAPPGAVVVGEHTALAVAEAVELERLEPVEAKGKAHPVRAWRAARVRPERSRDDAMGRLHAPILGRDGELAWLSGLRERARAAPVRATVLAPPGVGKSRLVAEFTAAVDAATWSARLRPDVLAPYDAVRQLLVQALAHADLAADDGAARRAALELRLADRGVSPARAAVVADEVDALLEPAVADGAALVELGQAREARFRAWLEALDSFAGDGGAVWVVEDAHWAGGDLLAFLDLAGAAPGARLVVVTARPSLLEQAAAFCRAGSAETLELPPLPAGSAADLIMALVGPALGDELVARIAARSDGNPLFIEELLRTWVSVGTLVGDGEGWRLADGGGAVDLPTTVQAIYGAQLDDLTPSARAVARRASVGGRTFPGAALPALDVDAPEEGLDVLLRRALLSGPRHDGVVGPSFAYRHALLRDAGYASLARAERATLHVRYASWLEETTGARAGELAEVIGRHYAAAASGAPALAQEVAPGLGRERAAELAASWFERGAEAALELAAHEAACSLLGRALELTPAGAPLDEARRRLRLGHVTALNADMDVGASDVERALDLYRGVLADDDSRAARDGFAAAVAALGWIRNQQVRFDLAAALADEGLATLGEPDDVATARLLVLRAVSVNHGTDEVDGPRADAERALGLARAAADADLEIDALAALAQVGDRMADWEQLQSLALERRRWETAAGALRVIGAFLLERDVGEALDVLDRTEELCRAHGLTESLAWTEYSRTEAHALAGDWDAAIEAGRRAVALGEANGYHRATLRTWSALLPIAVARHDAVLAGEADRWMERFEPPARPSHYALVLIAARDLCRARFGLVAPFTPDIDERLPAYELAYSLNSWYEALDTVLCAWLDAGLVDGAQEAAARARRTYETDPESSAVGRAVGALLVARTAAAAGRHDGSARDARAAAEGFADARVPWWRLKALRLLEAVGAASPADVAEAEALAARLGVRWD
jgi:class 3 adenylate cyclase/tetratricopeptide (TPR) repeat protein